MAIKPNQKIWKEEIALAHELRMDGVSLKLIAKEFCVTQATLCKALHVRGLYVPKANAKRPEQVRPMDGKAVSGSDGVHGSANC